MKLSIIIPVLEEASVIGPALEKLSSWRRRGIEVVVVDGGSKDATLDRAKPFCDRAISAPRGRGAQMNAGAAAAKGDVLLFLHADTQLPAAADSLVIEGLNASGKDWGRFDVRIDGGLPLTVVAAMMNWRSRLTGIATGDQAIFVKRGAFEKAGGFPAIALMEDIALAKTLLRASRPLCLHAKVTTSGRRWQKHGIARTIWLMWRLRLAYFFGTNPATLAQRYGYGQRRS